MSDDEYRPRPNDNLVEPFFAGLEKKEEPEEEPEEKPEEVIVPALLFLGVIYFLVRLCSYV